MLMLWTFKLGFNEDILAFLVLVTVLANIYKIWAFLSQPSGHPGLTLRKKFLY
jgi:hypothetical protein